MTRFRPYKAAGDTHAQALERLDEASAERSRLRNDHERSRGTSGELHADLSLRAAGEAPSTGPGSAEAAGTTGNPAAGAGVAPEQGAYEDEGVGRREEVGG